MPANGRSGQGNREESSDMSVEGLERGPLHHKLVTADFGAILDTVLSQDLPND